jgi:phytol kinase
MSAALRDALGIVASYAFVFGFIGAATILMRRGVLAPAITRKVIHIGVAHWWLIAMAMMDDPWVASVGPASFIVINALAIRLRFLPAMDEGADARNWGTVYFPISLLILVNLCWRGVMPVWVGGLAILVLGWGDGLAAIIGEAHGGTRMRIWGGIRLRQSGKIRLRRSGGKSVAGTAAMFAASFAVTLIFTLVFSQRFGATGSALGVSALVALAATAVEVLTPLGIDNITVPLATALLYAGVFA